MNTKLLQDKFNQAVKLHQNNQTDLAVPIYAEILSFYPNNVDALHLLGVALYQCQQFQDSLKLLDKAILINPEFANAYSNRGLVLQDMKRFEEALESYDRAILINPEFANAYHKRGNVLRDLKRFVEALESYDRAILINPKFVDAKYNKSLVLLMIGEFDEGFQLYEYRWKSQKIHINFNQPLWLGSESINGKTIFIYSEQGYGDTIQFCRYIDMVSALGADVIFQVEPSLYALVKQLNGVQKFIQKGEPLPEFDYHCPLLSLPLAFKTSLETVPHHNAYLKADLNKRKIWEKRLGSDSIPKIGLAWSGSLIHKNDHNRSIPLDTLLPYLPKGYQYICLQKEIRELDRMTLDNNPHIQLFGDELNDFSDTAALCDLVDMVISVDTSIAHLSGALGKFTIVLLPFISDWRWLLDRDNSPWYPSMYLLRQEKDSDWDSCLSQLSKIKYRQ